MNTDLISDKRLALIASKVFAGIPADKSDCLYMLSTNDILDLGRIADHMRRSLHSDKAYYGVNMNLNYTNICELRCPLCAFSCDAGDANAYVLSLEDIEKRVAKAVESGIDEVHIVGGLHPELKLDYFEKMLRTIKKIKKDIVIVAFTAVEYDYFARLNNITIDEVFKRLIDSGLDALPGGGAEVFDPEVRSVISPGKISGRRWLEVMKAAHKFGLKTNATMLYNQLETRENIADHLLALRETQEETGGFKAFVPLLFHEENTKIKTGRTEPTGFDDIRIYATSRIMLHNIPHIKALWMYVGEKMAQLLLNFGADEMGATYYNEKVVHAAGAKTSDYGSEAFLIKLIKDTGMQPVRTTALYGEK